MIRKLGPDTVVPGFALEKYEPHASASPSAWYIEVSGRHTAQFYLSDSKPEIQALGLDLVTKIIDSPVISTSESVRIARPSPLPSDGQSRRTVCVEPLTTSYVCQIRDVLKMAGNVRAQREDETNRYLSLRHSEAAEYVDDVLDKEAVFGNVVPHSGRYAHVRIDLDALETTTVTEFKSWLKIERRRRELRRAGGTIRPADWHRDRILPCIDLDLWAMARNARWPASELADRLYPDDNEERGERHIETARKTARVLLGDRLLERLYAESMRGSV